MPKPPDRSKRVKINATFDEAIDRALQCPKHDQAKDETVTEPKDKAAPPKR